LQLAGEIGDPTLDVYLMDISDELDEGIAVIVGPYCSDVNVDYFFNKAQMFAYISNRLCMHAVIII
jgi:hypothetical protein